MIAWRARPTHCVSAWCSWTTRRRKQSADTSSVLWTTSLPMDDGGLSTAMGRGFHAWQRKNQSCGSQYDVRHMTLLVVDSVDSVVYADRAEVMAEVLTSVCLFANVYLHAVSNTDAARLNKLDTEMFHRESYKPIYFGVKRSRSRGTRTHFVFQIMISFISYLIIITACTILGRGDMNLH